MDNIRDLVCGALDTATGNGYDMRILDDNAVALDLGTYCPDLEGVEPETLLPHIRAWKESR
jgi:hypothetical protein